MSQTEEAILRTLAFHAAWGYAPTQVQLMLTLDNGGSSQVFDDQEVLKAIEDLRARGAISIDLGRISLSEYSEQIGLGREKEISFPRKLKKARRVALFLNALPWVRAVFLCNTAALGQSSDRGDLDFFVVTRQGGIWRSRLASVLPFLLKQDRPGSVNSVDPICLSFFISDGSLDLATRMLGHDDPYFRYWFLHLLPLREDGVLQELWNANANILQRHPFAKQWLALDTKYPQDVPRPTSHVPRSNVESWSESIARKIQEKMFPEQIKLRANLDTSVMIDDFTLKFHVKDNRQAYKDTYFQICQKHGVKP